MQKKLEIIKKSFPHTIPVLFGYVTLGFAFGVLLQAQGFGPLWAFFMSVFIYAGSAQFLCVELLAVGASLPQVALLNFLLNFRHFFYGLSMIDRYKNAGPLRKFFLIYQLTDETYAVLTAIKVPEGIEKEDFYDAVSTMHHIYWIIGSVLGGVFGTLVTINTVGIDFAMTALFAVLVVEQWKANRIHFPAFLGLLVPIVTLYILGADKFLIPALVIICVVLLVLKKPIEAKEKMIEMQEET